MGFWDSVKRDFQAIFRLDPAARGAFEVLLTYPGFHAIFAYRIAHLLWDHKVPLVPRLIQHIARFFTGIEIHPAAKIGPGFFIDHGMGVVIGETTEIGECCLLYQGVTLGALSVNKGLASTKRHPTIEDDVIIYANATILGGDTVIGRGSVIGGNVWITASVPPDSIVYFRSEIHVKSGRSDFDAPDFVI